MNKSILVIGGTRYFGKRLVRRLVEAGDEVTIATRGRTPDTFGDSVKRIKVDRRDRAAMLAAFRDKSFDVVYDQMCYSPHDVAISLDVFTGRVGHYIMSSTIEVYNQFIGEAQLPLREADLDLEREVIEFDYPWNVPKLLNLRYGAGKRQAEALFYRDGRLPVTSVRICHVLGGSDDFTGRLAHYVAWAKTGQPLPHTVNGGASSFMDADGITDFLCWVGGADSALGPINAASDDSLTASDIYRHVCTQLGVRYELAPVRESSAASFLSPFDYRGSHRMDMHKARHLGYKFQNTKQWLGNLIRQHADLVAQG